MRDFLRLMGVLVLVGGMCVAQVGPPACVVPGRDTGCGAGAGGAAYGCCDSGYEEEEAADPTVLLAAEPLPNFGVERFRLEDYARVCGESGCYWADLDAQWSTG